MELFNKIILSNNPLIFELLNKNDYIKFLKKDKTFHVAEQLNNYHEESRSKALANLYNEFRNEIKSNKYFNKLKNKIEKHFYPSKFHLEEVHKINKNMHDLQNYEKTLFDGETLSSVESDDSELLRNNNKIKELKKKNFIKLKEKAIPSKNKFKRKPVVDSKKLVEFMKDNTEMLKRFYKYEKIKKETKSKSKKSESKTKYSRQKINNENKGNKLRDKNTDNLIIIKTSFEENKETDPKNNFVKNNYKIEEYKENISNFYSTNHYDKKKDYNENFFLTGFIDKGKKIIREDIKQGLSNYTSQKNISQNNFNSLNDSISLKNLTQNETNSNINALRTNYPSSNQAIISKLTLNSQNNLTRNILKQKSPKMNQKNPNSSLNLNGNQVNFQNSNNYDNLNTSFSSTNSHLVNKSIIHFNSINALNNRANCSVKIDQNLNLVPQRILSANNLNEYNKYAKNVSYLKETFENSDTIKRRIISSKINHSPQSKSNKISNQAREKLFKVKNLNEEILGMAPPNDEILDKIPKKLDFKREKFQKLKSEYRSSRFYQDGNYDKITSNFKSETLKKFNNFYTNKFNINLNGNMNFSQKKDGYFEQNPIMIDFKNKKIKNCSEKNSKNRLKNLIENKNILKKKELFYDIDKIEENYKLKKMDLKSDNPSIKTSKESMVKQLLFKAKKNVDLEDLKSMVIESIVEFKNSKGFLSEDFDTNKALNKINKVKYDLYNYRNNKKK